MSAVSPARLQLFPVARRGRSRAWVLVGALLAAVAGGAAFLVLDARQTGADHEPVVDRLGEARAYRDAMQPLLKEGGRVVGAGLRPGVADVAGQRYGPDVLASMAEGWANELEAIRAQVSAVEPPAFLAGTHWLFVQSLDGYVNTARAVKAAAAGDAGRRDELIDLAAALGEAADRLFDRADTALDRATLDRTTEEK